MLSVFNNLSQEYLAEDYILVFDVQLFQFLSDYFLNLLK